MRGRGGGQCVEGFPPPPSSSLYSILDPHPDSPSTHSSLCRKKPLWVPGFKELKESPQLCPH